MFDYDRFNRFFSDVTPDSLDQLDDMYHVDVRFIDPVHDLQGVPQIRAFWEDLLDTVISCETDILHSTRDEDRCYSSWNMRLRHPRIKKGAPHEVGGMSELLVKDDKVIFHRDFYCMGEMLYEQIPVLGSLIKAIKRKV